MNAYAKLHAANNLTVEIERARSAATVDRAMYLLNAGRMIADQIEGEKLEGATIAAILDTVTEELGEVLKVLRNGATAA
jgi:hypothetical protein